jgi:hypothetical protein
MMWLPKNLEQQLWHEIEAIEENQKMQYVTSVERMGIAKGVFQGESKLLRKQLVHRFGSLPEWVSDKLNQAGEQDLERWGEAILTEATLDDMFNENFTFRS